MTLMQDSEYIQHGTFCAHTKHINPVGSPTDRDGSGQELRRAQGAPSRPALAVPGFVSQLRLCVQGEDVETIPVTGYDGRRDDQETAEGFPPVRDWGGFGGFGTLAEVSRRD